MTFVDVTDSVNVERALKDKNEALQKADQLKNDFVQHVSYELRSPLTNIIGFTELLRTAGHRAADRPRSANMSTISASSSSVLLTIVNDILDLATVDAGIMELDIAEVDIDQTIDGGRRADRRPAARARDHAEDRDRRRRRQPSMADENRVRQILFNLLTNAANYAPDGSTDHAVMPARRRDGVEFSVHDDGPGMPPEMLDTVFAASSRAANGGRRRGAGLGLSIVKSFVELHGGTRPDRDRARNAAPPSSACSRRRARAACARRRMNAAWPRCRRAANAFSPTRPPRRGSARIWRMALRPGDLAGAFGRSRRRQDDARARADPRHRRRSRRSTCRARPSRWCRPTTRRVPVHHFDLYRLSLARRTRRARPRRGAVGRRGADRVAGTRRRPPARRRRPGRTRA